MNLKLQGVGAEPKKIGALVALVLAALYLYFSSGSSSSTSSVPQQSPITAPPAPNIQRPVARPVTRLRPGQSDSPRMQLEYRPSLKPKNLDRANIDPRLHTDLLQKLRAVTADGAGSRSLFDFSAAPKTESVKIDKEPPKVAIVRPFVGPKQPPPPPPPPGPPSAPPIPLKFYGFVNRSRAGVKSAFFLDGEDIIVAAEGDLIKKRYKIVSIGLNSAVVEDTQFKN
ncbi:MAG: hypothetical protein M3O35_01420, partial [Acidobacteriota bacterium]|nr:hypothetical protein [Acidobacteriota bacterium]